MAALFYSSVDAHQDGLRVRTLAAAIAVARFANEHRRSNRTLRQIVLERHPVAFQKRKHVVAMSLQPLDQSSGLAVLPIGFEHLPQSFVKQLATRGVRRLGRLRFFSPQPNRVADQSPQFLGERRPILAAFFCSDRPFPNPAANAPGSLDAPRRRPRCTRPINP